MIRPEHPFDIRPDLRKAASTKAESTTAESVTRPKQLVRELHHVIKNRDVFWYSLFRSSRCRCQILYYNLKIKVVFKFKILFKYSWI